MKSIVDGVVDQAQRWMSEVTPGEARLLAVFFGVAFFCLIMAIRARKEGR